MEFVPLSSNIFLSSGRAFGVGMNKRKAIF